MTTTTLKIEEIATWSEAKEVKTKNGPRMLRTAYPSQKFWDAWRNGKESLRMAGVSVSKDQRGEWQACWWLPLEEAVLAIREEAKESSRAVDANVNIPCPSGLAYLGYQKAGIAYAQNRPATLIADEMGLGKTIQAIGLINADETIKTVLVVCPASLRLNWKREIEKWTIGHVAVNIVNGGKPSDWPEDRQFRVGVRNIRVYVVNYDVLAKHRKSIDAIEWDLLVADEAHLVKNPSAIRTKALFGQKTKSGEVKQTPINAKRKLFLTGTPIVNRPVELWPLVQSLDPTGLGRNFFGYAKRYCNAVQSRWGWDFSGASHLDELQDILRERFMVRRLKKDVLTELPAKQRQVIEIPANGAGDLIQAEMDMADYLDTLEGAEKSKYLFEELSAIRHETALAKVPYVIDHVEAMLEEGPVVLFAHHKDVIQQIAEKFAGRCVTLTGETSMEDRQAAVDAFQAGKAELFVGNIQAAGVGITLTRASRVVFAELDWVPGNMSQCEDRCHRIGQRDSVLVQHLVLEGSLDAKMVKTIIAKQGVINGALDDMTEKPEFIKPIMEVAINVVNESSVLKHRPVTTNGSITTDTPAPNDFVVAETMTEQQIAAVYQALRMLAGMCDGAVKEDGCGFNKFDSRLGKELASKSTLSVRQALLGRKLATKYVRQIGKTLVAQMKG